MSKIRIKKTIACWLQLLYQIILFVKLFPCKWLFCDMLITFANSFVIRLNCMMVGQATDSIMALMHSFNWLVPDAPIWRGLPWLNLRFSLAQTICES